MIVRDHHGRCVQQGNTPQYLSRTPPLVCRAPIVPCAGYPNLDEIFFRSCVEWGPIRCYKRPGEGFGFYAELAKFFFEIPLSPLSGPSLDGFGVFKGEDVRTDPVKQI